MNEATLFCMIGKHAGPNVKLTDPTVRGWRLLKASFKDGEWAYDPNGSCSIYICPEHTLKGEPNNN